MRYTGRLPLIAFNRFNFSDHKSSRALVEKIVFMVYSVNVVLTSITEIRCASLSQSAGERGR